MIFVQIKQIETAGTLLRSASKLAIQLQKTFGVLSFVDSEEHIPARKNEMKTVLSELNLTHSRIFVRTNNSNTLTEICEELDASFLLIQQVDNNSKSIRGSLNNCRELRIPYILYKDSFGELDLQKVILPVGFLEEEIEKAQFASAFGRFCGSEIKMLLANDYGSKAAVTANRMKLLFDKFDFRYTLDKGKKDSFKVETEAVQVAEDEHAGLIIVSASRDYGLDDILFGPKEYHVLKKASVPVLLVNPRGDLYALCD